MQWLTLLTFTYLVYSMNWTLCESVDWTDTLYDDDYEAYYNNDNYQYKRQYPLTNKRYMTIAEEKKFWNKLFNGIRPVGFHKFTPPRAPTTLRFG
ncbi:unnamed protein product [Heterobilharzia americana]|nr:unnamed protein product [Heterobilharzia americana]CAH8438428.1 unnamed protein product [Heterobilharzia americana]